MSENNASQTSATDTTQEPTAASAQKLLDSVQYTPYSSKASGEAHGR